MQNQFDNFFRRDIYFHKISPFIGKKIIKVLVGHRRVGKSYVLYGIIEKIKEQDKSANIIYINKEDVAFDEIRDYKDLHNYIISKSLKGRKNYIFVDEVQMINNFHKAIASLALNSKNDIYITGSNSEMLSSDIANELGGRYIEFRIYGLSYLEFLQFNSLKNNSDNLERYMRFGGLPYLLHLPYNEAIITEYLRSIYSTIILKDIIQRQNIRQTVFLEQLIKFLAGNVGQMFSAKKISEYLKNQKVKMGVQQVIEYTRAVSQAFVTYRAERYDIVGKKTFEIGEKFYFEDLGIRNVLVGYKPQDKAQLLENVVYHHLLTCGYDVKVGTVGNKEIDFVATKNNETMYIQVAVELLRQDTIEREFGNLASIKDNYPKTVVTAENTNYSSYDGIKHLYIGDFLTTEW
ncbi:MAG: ATP-binding protein [Bacteroidales bacterium]|jgi:predicted AAA+ superfamily ATPase|nr:ATP-binding protein [Bacteroidales bacterium]